MMKRGLVLLLFVFMLAPVSAISITNASVNDTLRTVSVSDAVGLYAYEVNFDYAGTVSVGSSDFYNFLQGEGDSTTKGSDEKDSVLSVYESILSSSSNGVNGSGALFNVTHSSTLTLSSAVLVFANGTEMTIDFTTGEVSVSVSSGGGSAGSSGGGGSQTRDPIELSEDILSIETFPGETVFKEVTLTNNKVSRLDITSIEIQGLDEFLEIDESALTVSPSGEETVVLKFEIPVTSEPDIYPGRVLFVSDDYTAILTVIVDVQSVKGALFDVVINFPQGTEFAPGENVIAEIEVDNFGDLRRFDFDLFYAIKDFEGRTLAFAEENIAIETKVELIRELMVPRDTELGDYIFIAKASYEDAVASGSKTFSVVGVPLSPFTGNVFLIVLGVAVVIIVIVTLIVVFHFRGKKPSVVKEGDMRAQFHSQKKR